MKVYVVFRCGNVGQLDEIDKIFTDEGKAAQYCLALGDDYFVEIHEVVV